MEFKFKLRDLIKDSMFQLMSKITQIYQLKDLNRDELETKVKEEEMQLIKINRNIWF